MLTCPNLFLCRQGADFRRTRFAGLVKTLPTEDELRRRMKDLREEQEMVDEEKDFFPDEKVMFVWACLISVQNEIEDFLTDCAERGCERMKVSEESNRCSSCMRSLAS